MTFADQLAVLDDPAWWALVEGLRKFPDDALRKLVAADWLREREMHDWADLIAYRVNPAEYPLPERLCWVDEPTLWVNPGLEWHLRDRPFLVREVDRLNRRRRFDADVAASIRREAVARTFAVLMSRTPAQLEDVDFLGAMPLASEVRLPLAVWHQTKKRPAWGPFLARRFPINRVHATSGGRPLTPMPVSPGHFSWARADPPVSLADAHWLPPPLFEQLAKRTWAAVASFVLPDGRIGEKGVPPFAWGERPSDGLTRQVIALRYLTSEAASRALSDTLIALALEAPDTPARIGDPVRLPLS